ncbi:Os10g0444850 [Oryza sativa Japonica Group]|uniref:Os10g0444850 protein n=1 Tax=Oryza sativa subsp. japonica TaxID=39947 RepID=A0A0P0XUS6_ORYSJ|nr:Os10g0444850 [Oryza sativa Japonica Group]
MNPSRLHPASTNSEFLTPIPGLYPASGLCGSCAAYRNPNDPMMAPAFPAAAEMPWQVERSLAGKISAGTMKVVELGPKLAKKKVLAVEGDVEEEPCRGGADEVEAVAARELAGEEAEAAAVPGHHLLQLVLLLLDLDLEHLGHVGGGLLGVLGDEGGVARRLRHLHPPVVGEQRRHGAEHEDDPPHVVGLADGGARAVVLVRRRREPGAERGGDDEGDDAAGEDAEPLHREHGGDERAAGLLVGVLRHDRRRQRVVAADAESEPEPEEAERRHDAGGRVREREPRRDGADDHHQQRHPVHALPAELVAEPPEEELPRQRAAERDSVHRRGDVGRQAAGVLLGEVGVVDAAEQLGDEGDAEEVVGVGEEAHAGDDDRREVVPLRLRRVQRAQHLQVLLLLLPRHG